VFDEGTLASIGRSKQPKELIFDKPVPMQQVRDSLLPEIVPSMQPDDRSSSEGSAGDYEEPLMSQMNHPSSNARLSTGGPQLTGSFTNPFEKIQEEGDLSSEQ